MQLSVIIPTFNEAANIRPLVDRVTAAVERFDAEIVFVDDSADDTPEVIRSIAWSNPVRVRLIHRDAPAGGLAGAVIEGMREARSDWCVVMDGDLQHPPEMVPILLESALGMGADIAVASRYCRGGRSDGLDGWLRHLVSTGSIIVTRAMFPKRLRDCSDPMTGFFAVRRSAIDLGELQPRGFKILLEILARNSMKVVEEPFVFGERFSGESKADLHQGLRFLAQLAALRFGRASRFALIGGSGAVANLAIMALLLAVRFDYVVAAIVAAALTILGNFFAQERFVFRDLRHEGRSFWMRFSSSIGFNAAEAAVRLPFLTLLVEALAIPSLLAQAGTLAAAFLVRFLFMARVVYRARRTSAVSPLLAGLRTTSGLEETKAM